MNNSELLRLNATVVGHKSEERQSEKGDNMSTGEKIKTARKEFGWSTERLAREVGISLAAMRRIENVNEPQMNAMTAVRIARVLGLSLDFLLCNEC